MRISDLRPSRSCPARTVIRGASGLAKLQPISFPPIWLSIVINISRIAYRQLHARIIRRQKNICLPVRGNIRLHYIFTISMFYVSAVLIARLSRHWYANASYQVGLKKFFIEIGDGIILPELGIIQYLAPVGRN